MSTSWTIGFFFDKQINKMKENQSSWNKKYVGDFSPLSNDIKVYY